VVVISAEQRFDLLGGERAVHPVAQKEMQSGRLLQFPGGC
jgi:hypothetical protein